jgi:hypothetical protein
MFGMVPFAALRVTVIFSAIARGRLFTCAP